MAILRAAVKSAMKSNFASLAPTVLYLGGYNKINAAMQEHEIESKYYSSLSIK